MTDMKVYNEALQCQMTLQALAKEFNLLRKPGEPELGVAGVFGAVMQLMIDNEKLKAYAPDPFDDSLPTYAQITKDLTETEFELFHLTKSANLGLATTQELLEELMARARTGGYDQYKTLNLEDKQ